MFKEREKHPNCFCSRPVLHDLFAHDLCLSTALLDPNLEHWDNTISSSLSHPNPIPISRKKTQNLMFVLGYEDHWKEGYEPFEILDKSLTHITTELET